MRTILLVLCLALLPVIALAGDPVIWDEAIDGDLSTVANMPTMVSFVADSNRVLGTVGGPAPLSTVIEAGPISGLTEGFDDGVDSFTFTVPPTLMLTEMNLDSYMPTPGNTSTGFNLWSGATGPDGTFLGSCACTTAEVGMNLLTVFGLGAQPAGDYTMEIREFGTADNIWELTFTVPGLAVPVELEHFDID